MPSPFKPAEKWEPLLLARDTRNESRDSWNLLSIEADHNPLAIDPVTCAFEQTIHFNWKKKKSEYEKLIKFPLRQECEKN